MSLSVITEVGKFSYSQPNEARLTAQTVVDMLEEAPRIADCTACIGGNYIAFLDYDPNALALESAPTEYNALVKNVDISKKPHGEIVNNNCIDFLKTLRKDTYNILFFDPPWGGVEYSNKASIDMILYNEGKEINFLEFVVNIVKKDLAKFIVIKAPVNWNLKGFETALPKNKQITTLPIKRGHNISYFVHYVHDQH